MASRWRKWDPCFAVDVLDSFELPTSKFATPIMPMGRGEIRITFSKISIPKVEEKLPIGTGTVDNSNRPKRGFGRGRGHRVSKDSIMGPGGLCERLSSTEAKQTEAELRRNILVNLFFMLQNNFRIKTPSVSQILLIP